MFEADLSCQVCSLHLDTIPALLACSRLGQELGDASRATREEVKYEDIFSSDVTVQKKVTTIYSELLAIRENPV